MFAALSRRHQSLHTSVGKSPLDRAEQAILSRDLDALVDAAADIAELLKTNGLIHSYRYLAPCLVAIAQQLENYPSHSSQAEAVAKAATYWDRSNEAAKIMLTHIDQAQSPTDRTIRLLDAFYAAEHDSPEQEKLLRAFINNLGQLDLADRVAAVNKLEGYYAKGEVSIGTRFDEPVWAELYYKYIKPRTTDDPLLLQARNIAKKARAQLTWRQLSSSTMYSRKSSVPPLSRKGPSVSLAVPTPERAISFMRQHPIRSMPQTA